MGGRTYIRNRNTPKVQITDFVLLIHYWTGYNGISSNTSEYTCRFPEMPISPKDRYDFPSSPESHGTRPLTMESILR